MEEHFKKGAYRSQEYASSSFIHSDDITWCEIRGGSGFLWKTVKPSGD